VLRFLAAACGLFLVAAAARAYPGDADATLARLDEVRLEHDVPAFAVLLVDRRRTRISAVRGVADIDDSRPADEQTRFRIGSITKTFLALAVLRAQQDGLLRLEDAVRKWLPEPPFVNPYSAKSPIRLDQLLEHTAGLQDWMKDEWDLNDPLPLAEALEYRPESRRVRWPPGWHTSYSNNGAGIVSRALEEATGKSLEQYLHEQVFGPLGMNTARLEPDRETLMHLATGYDIDGRTAIPYWHVIFRASAAMILHPDDMAPALGMFLNRGRTNEGIFLPEADVRRMERMQTTLGARAGLDFGYGLGLRQWQTEGHSFFGHGGDGDGYLAHFGYCPDAGLAYFVVINAFRHRPLRLMRDIMEAHIVGGLPARNAQASAGPTKDRLEQISGTYVTAVRRFPGEMTDDSIQVVVDGDRIFTVQGQRRLPLLPAGGDLYRRPDESVATFAIIDGPDGRRYLQGPVGSYVRPEDTRPAPGL
jgi:CubicO group peptidase (beta-lactamase class C family)